MDKKTAEQINLETRNIYHKQHTRMVNDKTTMDRLHNMMSEEFFGLEKDFFVGKKVLDAGCGSTARNSIAFYEFGCRDITALDIGDEWKEIAKENFKNYNVDLSVMNLVNGNAGSLPFEDGTFDFVCLDGVIPHLPEEQISDVIKEMSRVTKENGYFFTSYLAQSDSLMDALDTAVRDFYRRNEGFAHLVDNISPEVLNQLFGFIALKLKEHQGLDVNIEELQTLFDEDLCISIQNTIQCQIRNSYKPDYINGMLVTNGFEMPRRIKRYVKRNNIRKYVSPLHFYDSNDFSKIIYADGYIDCIMKKVSKTK